MVISLECLDGDAVDIFDVRSYSVVPGWLLLHYEGGTVEARPTDNIELFRYQGEVREGGEGLSA